VHIEELLLSGFSPGEEHLIGEAIEHELTRLFHEQGVPLAITQGGEIARLNTGSVEVDPGSRTEAIGIRLAHAVYRRMTK
jgi:hypothetical protein